MTPEKWRKKMIARHRELKNELLEENISMWNAKMIREELNKHEAAMKEGGIDIKEVNQ